MMQNLDGVPVGPGWERKLNPLSGSYHALGEDGWGVEVAYTRVEFSLPSEAPEVNIGDYSKGWKNVLGVMLRESQSDAPSAARTKQEMSLIEIIAMLGEPADVALGLFAEVLARKKRNAKRWEARRRSRRRS
jgi:hypothetical protein